MLKRIIAVMTIIGSGACGRGDVSNATPDAGGGAGRGRARSTCSSGSTRRRSCRCMRTDSARCRSRKRRSSGICIRRRSPAATSSTTRGTRRRLEMRDVLEAILAHPQSVDKATLDEITPLHEAVLDQQRSVQQPDRPQVRAAVHAGRRWPPPHAPPQQAGATFPLQDRAKRSISCWRGCSRCSSIRTSIRSSPARRRRRARTSSPPAPTTSTSA